MIRKPPYLLYFFIIKNISVNYLKTNRSQVLSCEHSPILLVLSKNIIQKEINPVFVNNFTAGKSFRQTLVETINVSVNIINYYDWRCHNGVYHGVYL